MKSDTMNISTLKKRLDKLRSTYETAFEELLLDKEAKIPFERKRLLDMKKMLFGQVIMTDKLINGLESALKKLLRCRMIIEISDDETDSDDGFIIEEAENMSDNQSDPEDKIVIKSVPEVSNDYLMKVPVSKNYKRIGEYSSMIQKEQFLELPEEIENPIPEPSEIENTIPINTFRPPSPAYVLKMTKLRPASSYAKPSNSESRNIVTVPYKPTVKLPCKVLKINKLNMIKNTIVPKQAPFNPRDDAIAIKHIKEKLYQKSYLKINEDEPIAIKPTPTSSTNHHSDSEIVSESSNTKVVEKLPTKKPKARRNTIAERPPQVKKIKSPKKERKVIAKSESPVEAENLDSTEEFIVDEEMVMYKQEDPIQSHPTIYTQEWLDLRLSTPEVPQSKTHSRQFDTIDPEGLMEHITTVPIKKRGRGRPRKHVVKKSIFEFNPTSVRIKKEFDL